MLCNVALYYDMLCFKLFCFIDSTSSGSIGFFSNLGAIFRVYAMHIFSLPVIETYDSQWGDGPDPQKIYKEDGYEYLQSEFPNMSYNRGCFIVADDDLNEEGEPFVRESYDELSLKNSVQADL